MVSVKTVKILLFLWLLKMGNNKVFSTIPDDPEVREEFLQILKKIDKKRQKTPNSGSCSAFLKVINDEITLEEVDILKKIEIEEDGLIEVIELTDPPEPDPKSHIIPPAVEILAVTVIIHDLKGFKEYLNELFKQDKTESPHKYFDLCFDFKNGRVWRQGKSSYDEEFSRAFKIIEKGRFTTNWIFQQLLETKPHPFNNKSVFKKLVSKETGNQDTKPKESWGEVHAALKKMISEKFVKISTHTKKANNWLIFLSEEEGLKLLEDKN